MNLFEITTIIAFGSIGWIPIAVLLADQNVIWMVVYLAFGAIPMLIWQKILEPHLKLKDIKKTD